MTPMQRLRIPTGGHRKRIVILGGGFGGVYTAIELQKLFSPAEVEIALISRENFFTMSPLLFEAGSGVLEFRHAVTPLRELMKSARFFQGIVEGFRPETNTVLVRSVAGRPYEVTYDHLVIALGGITNRTMIPGSEHALAFKTLGDAILLRNRVIDLLEKAETEMDREVQNRLLSIAVVGGGLVGVELVGELTEMVDKMKKDYPGLKVSRIAIHLIEAAPRVLREMKDSLADYAADTLRQRGVHIHVSSPVKEIRENSVVLAGGLEISCGMVVLAGGNSANPVLAESGFELTSRGQIAVDGTMRVRGRENVWALGDCAAIPNPAGGTYPPLAQHAVREGRLLARNLVAAVTGKGSPKPFRYTSKGTLAALGHYNGVAQFPVGRVTGFLAWWMWRSYYLMAMPLWSRRIRIIVDWTMALLFRPDTFKIDLGPRTPGAVPELLELRSASRTAIPQLPPSA